VLPVTFRLVKAVVLPTAPSKAAMPPAFTAKAKPPSTVLAKLTLPPAARLLLIERLTASYSLVAVVVTKRRSGQSCCRSRSASQGVVLPTAPSKAACRRRSPQAKPPSTVLAKLTLPPPQDLLIERLTGDL